MDKGIALVSAAAIYKLVGGKREWLLVKNEKESNWEFAKSPVRKGESSVRTVIRIMAERANLKARVLDEAGRTTATTVLNGKAVQQRTIYYLIVQKGTEGEMLGYAETIWVEYDKALRRIASKKEAGILKEAMKIVREREKARKKKAKA